MAPAAAPARHRKARTEHQQPAAAPALAAPARHRQSARRAPATLCHLQRHAPLWQQRPAAAPAGQLQTALTATLSNTQHPGRPAWRHQHASSKALTAAPWSRPCNGTSRQTPKRMPLQAAPCRVPPRPNSSTVKQHPAAAPCSCTL